jgi:hypothetical protein
MIGDLTTVAAVKQYLGSFSDTSQDLLVGKLITAISKTILNYVGRETFAVRTFVDVYDGNGKSFMLLRQWPVVSVSKIELPGMNPLTVASDCTCWPPSNGFLVEDPTSAGGSQQRLTLYGYAFPHGRSNIRVTYSAGYLTNEPWVIPASPYVVDTLQTFIDDQGVTFTPSGVALTAVTGTPAAGQYSVDLSGNYTFAAADVGKAISIAYSAVPADVEQAAIQWVGEDYKRPDRLGLVSMSIGGQQTVSYSQRDMSDRVARALNPFRRVTPT